VRIFGRLAPELFLVGITILYAIVEQGRWITPLGDFGIWMSHMQTLARGGRPLHEVRLMYGPGSIWALDVARRLFGSRVSTLAGLDFVAGLGAGLLCLRLFDDLLSYRLRWATSVLIAGLVFFMPDSGSLLYPYAPAVSLGLVLLLGALLLGFPRSRAAGPLRHSAAFLLAAAAYLTKQEIGIAAFLGLTAGNLAVAGLARKLALLARGTSLFVLGVLVGYASCLQGETFLQLSRDNQLWPFFRAPASFVRLYLNLAGIDEPFRTLRGALGGSALIAMLGSGVVLVWHHGSDGGSPSRRVGVVAAIGALVCLVLMLAGERAFSPIAAAPVLLVPEALRSWKERKSTPRRMAMLFSGAPLLLRAGFRGSAQGPFFGLGMLLLIPLLVESVGRFPETLVIEPRRQIPPLERGWAVALIAIAAAFTGSRMIQLRAIHQESVPADTPRGRVWLPSRWRGAFQDIGRWLTNSPGDEPVAILPETHGLDFLFSRQNASPIPNPVPGIMDQRLESEILGRWRERPPALVVVFEDPYPVFDSRGFGRDFGQELSSWISERYERAVPRREWPIAYSIYRRSAEPVVR
jgi:hypothetical protein